MIDGNGGYQNTGSLLFGCHSPYIFKDLSVSSSPNGRSLFIFSKITTVLRLITQQFRPSALLNKKVHHIATLQFSTFKGSLIHPGNTERFRRPCCMMYFHRKRGTLVWLLEPRCLSADDPVPLGAEAYAGIALISKPPIGMAPEGVETKNTLKSTAMTVPRNGLNFLLSI